MSGSREDESYHELIAALKTEIQTLTDLMHSKDKEIRRFMEAEDPGRSIFYAQEIFKLKQEKLQLSVEITFRENKIKKILYDMDPLQ